MMDLGGRRNSVSWYPNLSLHHLSSYIYLYHIYIYIPLLGWSRFQKIYEKLTYYTTLIIYFGTDLFSFPSLEEPYSIYIYIFPNRLLRHPWAGKGMISCVLNLSPHGNMSTLMRNSLVSFCLGHLNKNETIIVLIHIRVVTE